MFLIQLDRALSLFVNRPRTIPNGPAKPWSSWLFNAQLQYLIKGTSRAQTTFAVLIKCIIQERADRALSDECSHWSANVAKM
jgi:hypothetical protein